jgi:S-(hydroxymethyl)glutathione dehydrogenase / alcohol dehydrogenase
VRTPIRAALLHEPGKLLELAEVLLDEPAAHEVVVRTERVGLCHSDLHYLNGALSISTPAVLGHEVAGVVQTVGLLTSQGREVTVLGDLGGFAEAFLASERSLAKLPPGLDPAVACLLGCCVSTGVGAALHGAKITAQDTVAVIGCGGVGIAAIQGARLAGARRIVAVDAAAGKLPLARRFGASDTVLADADPATTLGRLHELLPGGCSHSIEAVGRAATAELAFDVLAPGGTATILGLMPEGERLSISADALVYGDRMLRGAYMGASRFLSDVEVYTDHYLAGRLDLDAMITAVLPFARINDGFARMPDPGTIRIVLAF